MRSRIRLVGGAPPLPHDFAPQGVQNVPFLALLGPTEDQGPEGAPGGPGAGGRGGPRGPRGGRGPPAGVSGCPPGNPVWKAPGRRRRPSGRSDSTLRRTVGGTLPGGHRRREPPWGSGEEGTPLGDKPRAAATNPPTHLEPSATGIAGRGKSRRRRTKMGGRGDPSQEASVSVRTRLGLPAVPAAQGLADPKQTRPGGGGRQNPRG